MNHTLYLSANNRQAVLERFLRVTRHRGFTVQTLQVAPSADLGCLNIAATVSGERPVDFLTGQLKKLMDITSVEVLREEAIRIPA